MYVYLYSYIFNIQTQCMFWQQKQLTVRIFVNGTEFNCGIECIRSVVRDSVNDTEFGYGTTWQMTVAMFLDQ